MKKNFVILFFLLFFLCPVIADSWDDLSNVDRMWDGQKTITNQEFEQVMDALQENEKKKEVKKKKKKIKKISGGGNSLHEELNINSKINNFSIENSSKDELILNMPVNIFLDGKILEKGYYKIVGERNKEDGKVYINFYQSQFLKGRLQMTETQDDFGEELLDFVKVIPCNENFIKIIFGSVDFNAFSYVHFSN